MWRTRTLGVHAAGMGLLACLVSAMVGCAGGGDPGPSSNSGGSNTASNGGGETAPQAWRRLNTESAAGQILGAFVSSPATSLLQIEKNNADKEVDQAMQSPLPVEALDGMVDDVAQKMVVTIPEVPEVKSSPNKLILAFATIDSSAANSNPALAQALDSLRSKLSRSEKMTDNFVFVSSTESDANALNAKIAGNDTSSFRDPLQRTADTTHAVVYDPNAIFLITGSLYVNPDRVNHSVKITLSLTFTHVRSRRMVENEAFDRDYMWHPTKHEWELQP